MYIYIYIYICHPPTYATHATQGDTLRCVLTGVSLSVLPVLLRPIIPPPLPPHALPCS